MSPRELCPLKGVPTPYHSHQASVGQHMACRMSSQMGKEGSERTCEAHGPHSCLEEMLPTGGLAPNTSPCRRPSRQCQRN